MKIKLKIRFSKKRFIHLGWRIVSQSKRTVERSFYKFHKFSLFLAKFLFLSMCKYYSTILPMLLVSFIYFFPKEIRSVLVYLDIWGRVALFLLCIIRCFSLIGFTVLGGSASFLYGFNDGFLLFFFGSMSGTVLQYYAIRKMWIKIPGESILRKAPSPKSVLGVSLVRLCPFFPYDLVTIRLAYERKTSFTEFLRGTLFGSFPWFLIICLATAPHGSWQIIPILVLVGKILLGIGLVLFAALLIAVMAMR